MYMIKQAAADMRRKGIIAPSVYSFVYSKSKVIIRRLSTIEIKSKKFHKSISYELGLYRYYLTSIAIEYKIKGKVQALVSV